MKKLLLAAVPALLMGVSVNAQNIGQLTINGQINGSMILSFQQDIAGATISGLGTPAGTVNFGTYSVSTSDGTLNNITKSTGSSAFTLSTLVDVSVSQANTGSLNYDLYAAIDNTDQLTYSLNEVALTTTPQVIEHSISYNQTAPLTLSISVPFTASTQTVNRVIYFTATAN